MLHCSMLDPTRPKAALPSALTVFRTGVLKFHDRVFLRNLIQKRGLPVEVGEGLWRDHRDGLVRIVGDGVLD